MREYKCNVAQKGFFAGPVFYIQPSSHSVEEKAYDTNTEITKFHRAFDSLRNTILEKHSFSRNSGIIETVLSILDDEAFIDRIEDKIRNLSYNASAAVLEAANDLASTLNTVNSEYIRSRRDDILGVANKLVSVLDGINDTPECCSAICAPEISPALLSSIDENLIGAMLTDKGSPNSHASILAGNINIPYLYGNADAVIDASGADFVIIDSEAGTIIIDPDEEMKNNALLKMADIVKARESEDSFAEEYNCKTKVYANIEGPQDIEELLESGADGVGLFRTEFLFLGRDDIPSEDEQYNAYSAVLQAMGDKEVIIRTMDIGSDKKVSWLNISNESNPALGLRGVRVSLERKDLFFTQLRALLRAGVTGHLKVMFPMIASAWEIDEILDQVHKAEEELKTEGTDYRVPELGIMVETPAAAICADELAKKVSFFSIGTNDLTQYTLALDREAQDLDRYFKPHHEAVFRLIDMTAKSGHSHGIEAGICGQLASDPAAVKRLIESGVNELSVAIRKVKATKKLVAEVEKQLRLPPDDQCISAVADGELIPMSEIPDPVFSSGTLGECIGILPSNGCIYSPIDGTVVSIAKSGHAITLKDNNGSEFLVHVGINTVGLEQQAFYHKVSAGDHVSRNQLLMEADLQIIEDAGLSPMTIVIALS